MAKFIVHVELHEVPDNKEASDDVYQILHEAMEELEFKRTIVDQKTNIEYRLPRAVYRKETDEHSRQQIVNQVKVAAKQTGKEYSILVTHAYSSLWSGLTPVENKQ